MDINQLEVFLSVAREKRPPLPWRVKSFELAERKGLLSLHKLELELDRTQLFANLSAVTKKYLGEKPPEGHK